MSNLSNETKALIAVCFSSTIFGFGFMFFRIALLAAEQWVVLAWRFGLAFLVLLLAWVFRIGKLNLKGKPWGKLLLLGVLDPLLYYMLESWGLSLTNVTITAVMVALMPIVSLCFAAVMLKEYPKLKQTICALLSIAGVIVISLVGGSMGTVTVGGILVLLGAIVTAALFTVLSRQFADQFSAFERTFMLFLVTAVYFVGEALIRSRGDYTALLQPLHDPTLLLSLLYLGVLGSAIAYYLYNYMLGYLSVVRATVFSNWTTVVSIFTGIVFLQEPFSIVQIIGSVVILVGLYGVNRFAADDPARKIKG